MLGLKVKGIPKILFAHKYGAVDYSASIPAFSGRIEITSVIDGELTVTQDGATYTARRGDVLCNFYRSEMTVRSTGYHSHITVCFSVDVEPIEESKLQKACYFAKELGNNDACIGIIDRIIRTHLMYPESQLKISGLFLQLLGELDSLSNRQDGCSPSDRHYVARAKRYIYDNISTPIQQKDIAAFLGVTPEHLCSVFKRCEGRSVIRYINEIKLMNVRDLMEKKGATLSQAAPQLGFTDPNYVSRLYKKYYGRNLTDDVDPRS